MAKKITTKAYGLLTKLKEENSLFQKKEYGDLSMSKKLGNKIDSLLEMLEKIDKYYDKVTVEQAKTVDRIINELESVVNQTVHMDESTYMNQHVNIVAQFNNYFRDLKENYAPFRMEELSEQVNELSKASDEKVKEYIKGIDKATKELIKSTKDKSIEAQSLLETSKETIGETSLVNAQRIFTESSRSAFENSKWWLGASIFSILLLVGTSIIFLFCDVFKENGLGVQIHSAVLKIAILGGIVFGVNLCIRMFRAYTLISQKNKHKAALTNSLLAFLETAIADDVKDEVIKIIVTSIADFGTSGIIPNKSEDKQGSVNVGSVLKLFNKDIE